MNVWQGQWMISFNRDNSAPIFGAFIGENVYRGHIEFANDKWTIPAIGSRRDVVNTLANELGKFLDFVPTNLEIFADFLEGEGYTTFAEFFRKLA